MKPEHKTTSVDIKAYYRWNIIFPSNKLEYFEPLLRRKLIVLNTTYYKESYIFSGSFYGTQVEINTFYWFLNYSLFFYEKLTQE